MYPCRVRAPTRSRQSSHVFWQAHRSIESRANRNYVLTCPEVGFEDIFRKRIRRKGNCSSDFPEAVSGSLPRGRTTARKLAPVVPQDGYWSPMEPRSTVMDAIGSLYNVSAPPLTVDLEGGPSGSARPRSPSACQLYSADPNVMRSTRPEK